MKYLILFTAFLIAQNLYAESAGSKNSPTWHQVVETFDGQGGRYAPRTLTATSQLGDVYSSFYITRNSGLNVGTWKFSARNGYKAGLIKLNSSGQVMWAKLLGGGVDGTDSSSMSVGNLVVKENGHVIVAGHASGRFRVWGANDQMEIDQNVWSAGYTLELDANGNIVTYHLFAGGRNTYTQKIFQTKSGAIWIVGYYDSGALAVLNSRLEKEAVLEKCIGDKSSCGFVVRYDAVGNLETALSVNPSKSVSDATIFDLNGSLIEDESLAISGMYGFSIPAVVKDRTGRVLASFTEGFGRSAFAVGVNANETLSFSRIFAGSNHLESISLVQAKSLNFVAVAAADTSSTKISTFDGNGRKLYSLEGAFLESFDTDGVQKSLHQISDLALTISGMDASNEGVVLLNLNGWRGARIVNQQTGRSECNQSGKGGQLFFFNSGQCQRSISFSETDANSKLKTHFFSNELAVSAIPALDHLAIVGDSGRILKDFKELRKGEPLLVKFNSANNSLDIAVQLISSSISALDFEDDGESLVLAGQFEGQTLELKDLLKNASHLSPNRGKSDGFLLRINLFDTTNMQIQTWGGEGNEYFSNLSKIGYSWGVSYYSNSADLIGISGENLTGHQSEGFRVIELVP